MRRVIWVRLILCPTDIVVLEDTVNFVPDKESEKRLEKERLKKEKKKEAEEPAAKRRRVGEGPKKQGSITSFFRTSAK
jgi:formate hydrogenlyase subunit 6/NADH:ubiquinone oxidoreductase subunit I